MGEMIAGELPQIVFEESVTSTNDVAIEHGCERRRTVIKCARGQTEDKTAGAVRMDLLACGASIFPACCVRAFACRSSRRCRRCARWA